MNKPESQKKVWCLMGPTAVGKTDWACEWLTQAPFEIVSVDSAMIYREMNIGTAKPDTAFLQQYPHHLIDLRDPCERYCAADFCEDVLRVCDELFARQKIPLLVGGTMMYFHALQNGLSELPTADAHVRAQLLAEAEREGWDHLHARLARIDPQSAQRIHAHDTQRIQRALEVHQLTGQSLSSLLMKKPQREAMSFINVALIPESRAWLHDRIAQRFMQMLADGFLEEVSAVTQKWALTPDHPALRCVGYRQAWAYLQGQIDYSTFCDKGIAATRQLAKRQLTWLRQWPCDHVFYAEQRPSLARLREFITA